VRKAHFTPKGAAQPPFSHSETKSPKPNPFSKGRSGLREIQRNIASVAYGKALWAEIRNRTGSGIRVLGASQISAPAFEQRPGRSGVSPCVKPHRAGLQCYGVCWGVDKLLDTIGRGPYSRRWPVPAGFRTVTA